MAAQMENGFLDDICCFIHSRKLNSVIGRNFLKLVFYLSFWVKIEFPFSASLKTASGNEMAIHSSIPTCKSL